MILDGSKCREINEALVDLGFLKRWLRKSSRRRWHLSKAASDTSGYSGEERCRPREEEV